jgi:hypothetical protein
MGKVMTKFYLAFGLCIGVSVTRVAAQPADAQRAPVDLGTLGGRFSTAVG